MANLGDFSWLQDSDMNTSFDLSPFDVGYKYHIKSGNNWELCEYLGFDPEHKFDTFDEGVMVYPTHIFKTKYGTSYKSESYITDLIVRGLVKPYDPNFSFYQELNIKKVEIDAKGLPLIQPNFIIIFKNGVNIKDTYNLQKKLFKMGYKWTAVGKKLIKDNKVNCKVFTIESLNWDTSNRLYSAMVGEFGTRKILMLSTFENVEDESDKERRLNFIHDHPNVKVIDGDDLLSRI